MICYLSKNYKECNSAGNKAKTDIEQIMEALHYKNVGLKQSTCRNSILSFLLTLCGVLKFPFSLHKGDILVIQYPLKKYYTFVCRMAHMRGGKVVTLIHDLGSFRRKKLTEAEEIVKLNHSDYIIAHNDIMKQWLLDRKCEVEVGTLGIFDYLSGGVAKERELMHNPLRVIYAGALNPRKNTFLYKIGNCIHSYRFMLYGSGFESEQALRSEYFDYKGFLPSDKLIEVVDGDFGLVWDGESVQTCAGNFGEYLKINNPHKVSLYIRCGLPVIIWEKAALASFVREHHIGICIGSLEDLENVLSSLTEEEYHKMRLNVSKISVLLSKGYYFSRAMEKANFFFRIE